MYTGTVETSLTQQWSLKELHPPDVAEVRSSAVQQVTMWGYEADEAALVVTELVTNNVRHAGGLGTLYLQVLGTEQLFVGMSDRSRNLPQMLEPDWESDSGRGIYLIAQMSVSWGVSPTLSGKCVWALLRLVALPPTCYHCEARVAEVAEDNPVGKILQKGQPELPLVCCSGCSPQLVQERIGDDSGWGVLEPCLVA